jgi:hypothetical protein
MGATVMAPAITPASVLAPHRDTFRAFAVTVVPEMTELDEAGWADVERTIEHALAQRPARLRRQLGLLLRVIDNLPRARYGRRFSALDATRRAALIDLLQRAPLKLIRRGIWGLRTLVLMGCYTRVEAMDAVGYRAHARGWEARRSADS